MSRGLSIKQKSILIFLKNWGPSYLHRIAILVYGVPVQLWPDNDLKTCGQHRLYEDCYGGGSSAASACRALRSLIDKGLVIRDCHDRYALNDTP